MLVLATLALAGCATHSAPPLPDLATKKSSPTGQQTLSSAQQKQAIDQMIAKRDAK